MKVLQVLIPVGMGGVERIASQLVINSNNNDIDVIIAIDEKYYSEFLQYFPISKEKLIKLNCYTKINTIKSIKDVIRNIKPDIIHTHARKECVIVSVVNKFIPHIRTQHMEERPRTKVTLIEKKLLEKRVNYWVATSKLLEREYLLKKDYIKSQKTHVIYNGVCNGKFRDNFNPQKRFCIISRLTTQKGIDILLKQFDLMPQNIKDNIKVDIWGEGPELKLLTEMIEQFNLEKSFCYKGICKCPAEHFEDYDALLMPSRHEGLPLTMLESMSTGTPVAIHDVGCVREFIRNGKNGWIVNEEFTWQKFFEDFLYERISYKDICINARNTYEELFTIEKMCNSYYREYEKIVIK